MTDILPADDAGIQTAIHLMHQGAPVALPTETVYGLAADATQAHAVAGIYAAKGRPSFNPLIVHVPSLAAAQALVTFNADALRLAEVYWPGALTLVLPKRADSGIAEIVTAGLSTLAIRVPAHPVMQQLLRAYGKPLAAPSANASGMMSPTCAAHVAQSLGGCIPLILDGGACAVGLESTIIACAGQGDDAQVLRLLRPGGLTVEQITQETGLVVQAGQGGESAPIESPGQMASHYAPRKPLRLNAVVADADEHLIGFGAVRGAESLSLTGDLTEAAANLFAALHRADASSVPRIAIAPIPMQGLGVAINDRLARAAHDS